MASAALCVLSTDVAVADEGRFLADTRQITFEGRRAGEGYFAPDGKALVFQSEREPGNPFFQIYADGFDGLPVFSPDGASLSWTTNRTGSGESQLFLAAWNHPAAVEALARSLRRTSGCNRLGN